VYRAELPRTATLVVALSPMTAAAGVFVRRLQIGVLRSRQFGAEEEAIEQTRIGAIDLNRSFETCGFVGPTPRACATAGRTVRLRSVE
jgi:hypothetical protein